MLLSVVGCSGSMAGPDGPASSYLVQAPFEGRTFSLVLDLGPGAAGALFRHLDPREVDAIGLTHLHPDHCLDVCGFYVAARYSPTAPWPSIPVLGPADTRERLLRAYEVAAPEGAAGEPGPGIGQHFRYTTWAPQQRVGPFLVSTTRVEHPVEAYALRVEEDVPDGGVLVYSGDTGPCRALVELARGCDLLLAEAAFLERPDNPPGLHLTGADAARAARDAGVGELVLTHIPPWHDRDVVLAEAVGVPDLAARVSLAAPGASWTIGPR